MSKKSYKPVDVTEVERMHVTDQAVLIRQDEIEVWIPISQILRGSEVTDISATRKGLLVIPEWLAIDKELIHYQRFNESAWKKPATSYNAARRGRILERFEGSELWTADGTKVYCDGEFIGEFFSEEHAAIAANGARIVHEVVGELAAVHRWATMITGRPEEKETKAIESDDKE